MAVRTPLVLVNGQVQQLQAGDSVVAASSGGDPVVVTLGTSGNLAIDFAQFVSNRSCGYADIAATEPVTLNSLIGVTEHAIDGQRIIVRYKRTTTGDPFPLTLNPECFSDPEGFLSRLDPTTEKITLLGFVYIAALSKLCLVSVVKGF